MIQTDTLGKDSEATRAYSPEVGIPGKSIRRLTPTEAARLQGFPDDWCDWGADEKGNRIEISDTQKYRTLGNAVTTNVIEAIMRRWQIA